MFEISEPLVRFLKMSNDGHSTDGARSVNPGIGIPDRGKFTAEQFAEFFGVKPETIRNWLETYEIPHHKPGKCLIVDAEIFWQNIPFIDFQEG